MQYGIHVSKLTSGFGWHQDCNLPYWQPLISNHQEWKLSLENIVYQVQNESMKVKRDMEIPIRHCHACESKATWGKSDEAALLVFGLSWKASSTRGKSNVATPCHGSNGGHGSAVYIAMSLDFTSIGIHDGTFGNHWLHFAVVMTVGA